MSEKSFTIKNFWDGLLVFMQQMIYHVRTEMRQFCQSVDWDVKARSINWSINNQSVNQSVDYIELCWFRIQSGVWGV